MTNRQRSVLIFFALVALTWAQTIPLDALMRGGRIHYQGGRYERAREQFQKALEQYGKTVDNKTLSHIHLWLGLCDAQLNQLPSAADHFLTAIVTDTSIVTEIRKDEQQSHWVWTALIAGSRENYNRGEYEKALNYARAALAIEPAKSQTYALIANSYSALGKYDDMLNTAREMLAINTNSAEAYSLIGLYFLQKPDSSLTAELRRSRWDSTRYYYERALQIFQARYDSGYSDLNNLLKLSDNAKLKTVAEKLVELQRYAPPEELKRYIEKELNQSKQLAQIAQVTSKLFYAANNINVTASRLGSALLRASAEVKGDTANNFRELAEQLFTQAITYDPYDFTSLFNLGLTQYQGKKDSLAMLSFIRVIENTVVPINRLPGTLRNSLVSLISPEVIPAGYLEVSGPLAGEIDSTLFNLGYRGGGFVFLYFPRLKEKGAGSLAGDETTGIFLSNQLPAQLENVYLLLGVTQAGIGLSLIEANRKDAGKTILAKAVENLLITTQLNPNNADAFLNLVHCYRELGEKEKAESAYKAYEKLKKK